MPIQVTVVRAGLLNRQLDYKLIRELLKSCLSNNTNVLVNSIRVLFFKGKPETRNGVHNKGQIYRILTIVGEIFK